MKVKMGPYRSWIGPYQVVMPLKYLGVPEDTRDWIAERIPSAPFEWIHRMKKRKVKVRIDDYDVWGADHTLALIILPILKRLREVKHGSPFVDNEDVPENLRKTYEDDTGDDFHKKWEWVLNEIIWAFENIVADEDGEDQFYNEKTKEYDIEGRNAHDDHMQKALILFGKYYRGLWD
tara:strand:- start:8505 stop:9035 length:531 start_codon:yes stop_codon:yes gene_type:complete